MQVKRTLNFAMEIPYLAIFRVKLENNIFMLHFSTFNLSKCNISCKKTFLNAGPKLFYLGTFGLELEKATVLWFFYISNLKFFQTKFCSKIKILRFGTKIVLIRYFRLKFKKTRVEFEISILKFVNTQSFVQK